VETSSENGADSWTEAAADRQTGRQRNKSAGGCRISRWKNSWTLVLHPANTKQSVATSLDLISHVNSFHLVLCVSICLTLKRRPKVQSVRLRLRALLRVRSAVIMWQKIARSVAKLVKISILSYDSDAGEQVGRLGGGVEHF